MRILFDCKYNKYLGSLGFVLASINNGTINPLFVCTRANYGSGLRAAARTMQMKAFRLNKYENSGEALKCSDINLNYIQ